MAIKALKIVGVAILISISLMLVLMWSREFTYDPLIATIKKMRSTELYEGEDKAQETVFIVFSILLPIILAISFLISVKLIGREKSHFTPSDE
jgi:hypothetical protein